RVEAERTRARNAHKQTILDIVARARSGKLEPEGGFEDALIGLVSFKAEDQTIAILSGSLDEVRRKLPKLDEGDAVLARLLCEALGRLGRKEAIDPLARYLEAELDVLRAVRAAQALFRI